MAAPKPIPIDRLYDICLSFPANTKGRWLDWGHDYGKLMDRLPAFRLLLGECLHCGVYTTVLYLGSQASSPLNFYIADPLAVPEIALALKDSQEQQEEIATETISPIANDCPDCFLQLSEEIREQILILLPSDSVTSLRLAARSFAAYHLNQRFWAFRFRQPGERAYVYEAQDVENGGVSSHRKRDWKKLYASTSLGAIHQSKELKNRKRIWDCNRELVEILLEEPLTDLTSLKGVAYRAAEYTPDDEKWRPVGGEFGPFLFSRNNTFLSSCKSVWEQVISVPDNLRQIAISLRSFCGRQYVCGLRFVSDEREDVIVGYVLPGKETCLDMTDIGSEGGGRLNGFIPSVDPKGIRALRITTTAGRISKWVGSPEDLPQTVRLCMKRPIQTICACFDVSPSAFLPGSHENQVLQGLKLVSLAVPRNSSTLFCDNSDSDSDSDSNNNSDDDKDNSLSLGEHLSLRTTALWYPSIPGAHLNLNDESFAGRDTSLGGYRPFIHVIFGGSRGKYLQNLVRISVVVSKAAIVGIDFHYTGQGAPPAECIRVCPSTSMADDSVNILFTIYGPGGELLTGMQAGGEFGLRLLGSSSAFRNGFISSLKGFQMWHD